MMLDELTLRLEALLGVERTAALWSDVDDLVVKMVLSAEAPLSRALHAASPAAAAGHPNTTCFELLGIDVMLDAQGKPWLLEANLDPSMSIDDLHGQPPNTNARLKSQMLVDLLNVIGVRPPPPVEVPSGVVPTCSASVQARKGHNSPPRSLSKEQAEHAAVRHLDAELSRAQAGGWRRLLPSKLSEQYADLIGEERRELNLLPFACDGTEGDGKTGEAAGPSELPPGVEWFPPPIAGGAVPHRTERSNHD